MIAEAPAPWFFKRRFALFGGVYGPSIFGGFAIAGLLGIATQPLFLSAHPLALALVPVGCVLGGYALRVWASSFIAATIVWTQDVQLGELTVSGPYRFTRNPLYLGNLLQAIGIGTLGPWPVPRYPRRSLLSTVRPRRASMRPVPSYIAHVSTHSSSGIKTYRHGMERATLAFSV